VTETEMWGVLAEAATMLDGIDVDWRTLQQIEGMLSSLSTELERAVRGEIPQARTRSSAPQADADMGILRSSLAWVRRHEYVALESEIHQHLDAAIRHALGTLDRLGGWHQPVSSLAIGNRAVGDG
jgi:hypothetical protein